MFTALILGLLVGLDNLQLAAALGLLGLDRRRRWAVAGVFALFETAMPLLGLLAGSRLTAWYAGAAAQWLGPAVLLTLGAYIVLRAWREPAEHGLVIDRPWCWPVLPLVMSLDNLLAGLGLGAAGYPVAATALVIGCCAGGMCFLGLFVGQQLRRRIPGNIELVSGFYLIGLAIFFVLQ